MLPPSQWMTPVCVQGCVSYKSGPGQGVIWFVPNEVLIRYAGKNYATMGIHAVLDSKGGFSVDLSRCDIPGQELGYDVYLGKEHWTLSVVPRADGKPCEMSELISQAKEQT